MTTRTCARCGRRERAARLVRPKLIAFDYYGTLAAVDERDRVALFEDVARGLGLDVTGTLLLDRWHRVSSDPPVPLCGPVSSSTLRASWIRRGDRLFAPWRCTGGGTRLADAYARLFAGARPYADARQSLARLRTEADIAILSNADNVYLRASLAGFEGDVATVVSSEDAGVAKPHVRAFDALCSAAGVEPGEVWFVGDGPDADVLGARHAGCTAIWLDRGREPATRPCAGAHASVSSLADLLPLLAGAVRP